MASGAAGRANVGLCPASSSRKVRSTRYWSKCGPIKTGIVTYCARDGRRDSRHADYSSVVDCHDTMYLTENNATYGVCSTMIKTNMKKILKHYMYL